MSWKDNNFKFGDSVVCLLQDDRKKLTRGNLYVVLGLQGNKIRVSNDIGEHVYSDHLHFAHAEGSERIIEAIDAASRGRRTEMRSLFEDIDEGIIHAEYIECPTNASVPAKEEPKQDAKTGTDKRRFSLMPIEALQAVLDVVESGNIDLPWRKAYPVDSWKRKSGDYKRRYFDALSRHLFDYKRGKYFTEDTGLYTMAAVAINALFLLQFEIEESGIYPSDDGKKEIERMRQGLPAYETTKPIEDTDKYTEEICNDKTIDS